FVPAPWEPASALRLRQPAKYFFSSFVLHNNQRNRLYSDEGVAYQSNARQVPKFELSSFVLVAIWATGAASFFTGTNDSIRTQKYPLVRYMDHCMDSFQA